MITILLCCVIALLICGVISVRNSENKEWNKGFCQQCGLNWELFDVDSQGGRMYRCKNGHYCDITYNVDK